MTSCLENEAESTSGLQSSGSLGVHMILFVSQRNQVTHLLATRCWTALTPSAAPKNKHTLTLRECPGSAL